MHFTYIHMYTCKQTNIPTLRFINKIDFLAQAPKLMSVMSILSHLGRNHATVLQEFMYSLILASLTPDSSRYSTTVLQEFMYSLILSSFAPDSSRHYNCTTVQEFMYSLILSLNTVPNYIMQQRYTVPYILFIMIYVFSVHQRSTVTYILFIIDYFSEQPQSLVPYILFLIVYV